MTLMAVVGQPNVTIDDQAALNAFRIGLTADPENAAILIGLGIFLMNRNLEPDRVDDVARTLKRNAWAQHEVQKFLHVYEEWNRCGRKRCLPRSVGH